MSEKRVLDFYLGSWLIQPQQHRIRKNETEAIRVEPKVMDVLLCLTEFPGETVTRDFLLETVWEGTVVTDDVLTRCISELRKIFQDNPRKPVVIETIPKVGYRLMLAPALDHKGDSMPESVPSLDIKPLTGAVHLTATKKKSIWIRGVLVLFGILLFSIVILMRKRSSPTLHANYTSIPLTTFPGFEGRPVLSADGKQVAFAWGGPEGENTDIYVKLIGTESMLRLTDSPGYDFMPAWSPDGTRLAFMKREDGQCSIWIVPALGGAPVRLTSCGYNIYGDLAWSPDGTHLAFNDRTEAETAYSIYYISIDTHEKRRMTDPQGHTWGDHDPAFSPDGRWMSFTRSESEGMQDVYIVSLEDREVKRITEDNRNISGHDWVDALHLVFSSNRNGRAAIWLQSIQGGHAQAVNVPDEYAYFPSYSAGRMAYMKGGGEANIWRIALSDSSAPSPFIESTRWDMHPQYSPDGSHVAFTSNRSGTYEIWVSDSDARNARRLTFFNGPFTSTPRWSPDSNQLVFTGREGGEAHLYILEKNASTPRRITHSEGDHLAPFWSVDGATIYFSSNRTGAWEVWKKNIERGTETQLTFGGGFGPKESADGNYVFYSRHDEAGLWQIEVTGGDPVKRLSTLDPRDWGSWALSRDAGGIYYIQRGQPTVVVFEHMPTGQIDTLFATQKSIPRMDPALSVSPDFRYLLLGQVESNESDLVLIEDFLQ